MNQTLQALLSEAYQAYADGNSKLALSNAWSVLKLHPQHHEAYQIAAMCEARFDNVNEALLLQRQAVDLAPDHAEYHYNLAVVRQQAKQDDLAMLSYRNCLRLAPEHANALWNYSDLLRINEHFSQAVGCLETLLEMDHSEYVGIYHRLAVAYNGLGRAKAAARTFEKSLSMREPNASLTHWEYSHVLLGEGQLVAGWAAYESRYRIEGPGKIAIHPFEYPRWQGENLNGKTMLIHGEQGIGDQIMFASIIPRLIDEGGNIIIACHPSLCRLLSASFPSARVHPHTIDAPANFSALIDSSGFRIDYEVPICSLAHWRGPHSIEQAPAQGYLAIDPSRQAYFEQQIALYSGATNTKLRVGVMWSANPAKGVSWGEKRSLQKSVPIEQLAPLAALVDEITFVSLQNVDSGRQAAHAPGLNLLDFHDQLFDFTDTASLIACLDIVVSVDTSVAHLAGGLDKPVIVLLKTHADWRWLNQGSSNYWYPSARLLRQQQKGNWAPVIEHVVTALRTELDQCQH